MTSFTFSVQTQIQFGSGISRQVGAVTKDLVLAKRGAAAPGALVIIDPGIQGTDWLNEILESIQGSGLQYQVFKEVKPNPRDVDVYKAASMLTNQEFEAILAIGGGSTLDTAKTAALIATHAGKLGDYAGWAKVPGPILPLVAIPTTAGSGSEATCWAVITDTLSHIKLAIGDPNLAPKVALVDPSLTLSVPAGLTAATGMDVLTHSIEAYIGALSSPLNDLFALEAIRLVGSSLLKAVTEGENLAAREAMMLASTLGGIAINNADVAGVHCLSEGMGGVYDAPHGLLNAILLPYFMAFWQNSCSERFARIAEALGVDPRPEEAVNRVMELIHSLRIPSLAEVGVKQADLPNLAALAESNVSNSSNPIPMTALDYLDILEHAIAGQIPQAK